MAPVVTQSIMLLPPALFIHWIMLLSPAILIHWIMLLSPALLIHALTGASVTPVNTTTFRSGLILSITPGIYEVFLLAYAQISSVETPLVAGRHTDGNTPLCPSLSRGDQTEQPRLVAAGGLGAACHPIVCNH